jgi:hypothetical protein
MWSRDLFLLALTEYGRSDAHAVASGSYSDLEVSSHAKAQLPVPSV